MGAFLRTNITPEGFIQGAARLLVAPVSQAFPTRIDDIIVTASGPSQWDAKAGWSDLGATRTGINIARNNAEETFDVDQIQGDIASRPSNWEMSVGTALAEVTLERIDFVWEGGGVTTNATVTPNEKQLGLGQPESYTQRRLAVVYQRANVREVNGTITQGKVRAYVFRRVQRTPQDSSFTHQRTGEQATLPVRWRALADDTVVDVNSRFGTIFDQV